jgi:hypothetical protein
MSFGQHRIEDFAPLNSGDVSSPINGGCVVELSGRLMKHTPHLALSQPCRNAQLSPITNA